MKSISRHLLWAWLLLLGLGWIAGSDASELVLKDGRILRGKTAPVTGLAEKTNVGQSEAPQSILMVDDNLRRTFISKYAVQEMKQEEKRGAEEKIKIHQQVLHTGATLQAVGPPVKIQPFDEFGRRLYVLYTPKGPLESLQGITELTPQWCKVECKSLVWDMRIATSSIPREELHKILLKQINPKTPEDYKKIARFYLQAERYENAQQALDAMLAAFSDQPDLKEQLKPSMRSIAQLSAQQLLNELKLRRAAGQHKLVSEKLKVFSGNDVTGEILQGFRQMSQEYDIYDSRLREATKQLEELSSRIKDTVLQQDLHPILAEIAKEANIDTLDRLASFLQNADDKDTSDSEKVSLAISGWVLGADAATTRIDTAVSAYRVRDLLCKYLAETDSTKREGIFRAIRKEYAGDAATITAVAAHMKPPFDPPEPKPGKSGYYELKTPGIANTSEITYYVQLPPEYNPYRRYPTIVTLNGLHNSVENQVDWWAGGWKNGERTGQAARHGYIVIAPVWILGDQNRYGYSSRELAAALNPLRDACRRFSIDTDRVYLSGHSLGGDAAWDIGLAHPDLWAGVIPIVGKSDRYCNRYWKNAEYVPFYVVGGELDGNLAQNALDLNRYLTHRFETTVVEYIGRGHDNFYDEVQRLFQWTGLHKRNFFPREFACESMRPWDNSFWWVEMDGMPAKSMIDPADWPPSANAQTTKVSGTITNKNTINVRVGSSRATVWLSPEMLDFKQRAIITVNGQRINKSDQIIDPDLLTILEDLRTRADRQHPFWAKLEGSTGRVRGDKE